MSSTDIYRRPPTAFISCTHENSSHRDWVRTFAAELLFQGIQVTLDQFDLMGGRDLHHFMEKGFQNPKTTIVCDPGFKQKPDNRQGGVGDKMRIAAALLAENMVSSKFILILRVGERSIADPT